MDVDERAERHPPERDVRNPGNGCPRQHPRGAILFRYLERCGGKFLAVRWEWFRLRRYAGGSQRYVEVRTLRFSERYARWRRRSQIADCSILDCNERYSAVQVGLSRVERPAFGKGGICSTFKSMSALNFLDANVWRGNSHFLKTLCLNLRSAARRWQLFPNIKTADSLRHHLLR
jgi:hypothetical protein